MLIVTSKIDLASQTILRCLLKLKPWEKVGTFDGNPAYTYEGFHLITIEKNFLYVNDIDRKAGEELGMEPKMVIFASRHKSESGLKSLTVHSLGNFGKAEYGGIAGKLVPAAPAQMTAALRELKERARGLEHAVSFEATHHGPYLETPAFNIEVGSDEQAWQEEAPAEVVAQVILSMEARDYPVVIGVGGGHYAPRFTDLALLKKVNFAHIIPSYALENIGERVLREILRKSPTVEHVYFHRKAMKKPQVRELTEWFIGEGLRVVRQKELD